MKKFYREVLPRGTGDSFSIFLDEHPLKTPRKKPFVLPNAEIAAAIAEEWRSDSDEISPSEMVLTKLANSALDSVAEHREITIDEISGFAETDLVCYRSGGGLELRDQQDREWGALLDWMSRELDISLSSTDSILPLAQNRRDLNKVRCVVASFDDYSLAGLHMLTLACGSVVIGLAAAFEEVDERRAWELSLLEESYQIDNWGEDPEATKRREGLRLDIAAATRFLALLRN